MHTNPAPGFKFQPMGRDCDPELWPIRVRGRTHGLWDETGSLGAGWASTPAHPSAEVNLALQTFILPVSLIATPVSLCWSLLLTIGRARTQKSWGCDVRENFLTVRGSPCCSSQGWVALQSYTAGERTHP
jgi:hypothetical protein